MVITVPARMVGSLALPPQFQLWLASDLLEVVASAGEGVDVLARGRVQAQAPVPRIPIYAAPHAVAGHAAPSPPRPRCSSATPRPRR